MDVWKPNTSPDVNAIRIMMVASNPKGTDRIRFEDEVMRIQQAIKKSPMARQFEFFQVLAGSKEDLVEGLLDFRPNYIHFSTHGSENGIVLRNDRLDHPEVFKAEDLSELLGLFSKRIEIKCLFLNSCYSSLQAEKISVHIKPIIAMKNNTDDSMAILFAAQFYRAIGAGWDIPFAFEVAKNMVSMNGGNNKLTPYIISE